MLRRLNQKIAMLETFLEDTKDVEKIDLRSQDEELDHTNNHSGS